MSNSEKLNRYKKISLELFETFKLNLIKLWKR